MSKFSLNLFLTMLAGAALTACIRIPKQPETTGNTVPLTYRFDGGADMTSLFSLKATYLTEEGRPVTEEIGSLPWSKAVDVRKPFEARLEVKFAKKNGFTVRPAYAVGFSGTIGLDGADAKAITPPLGRNARCRK